MWDWLWNTLVAPWPDLVLGQFELRDLANLSVGVVGIILAYYAIKLGRRQADIVEAEHAILQAQLAAKPNLAMRIARGADDSPGSFDYRLILKNHGTKVARDVKFRVAYPKYVAEQLSIHFFHGSPIPQLFFETPVLIVSERIPEPLFPDDESVIASFTVASPSEAPVYFHWDARCEDGLFPPEGLAQLFLSEPKQPRALSRTATQTGQASG